MNSTIAAISPHVLEAVQTAILITDARGNDKRIRFVNQAFENLTGYSRNEVLGRDCRFLQRDDRDQIGLQEIRNGLLEQRSVHAILRNYRKDGSLFFNEVFIDPIRDTSGEVSHFVACQNAVAEPGAAYLRSSASNLFQKLSQREKEVFNWVVRGHTNKEIAREMELSPRTVEKHRLQMQRKMGTQQISLLTRYAIALGFLFEE